MVVGGKLWKKVVLNIVMCVILVSNLCVILMFSIVGGLCNGVSVDSFLSLLIIVLFSSVGW